MICRFCLQRLAVGLSRRCAACADYLHDLSTSDRQQDRDYADQLVRIAARTSMRRLWAA